VLPRLRHGVEVALLEGGVERVIGGEDAVEIADREIADRGTLPPSQ